MGAILVKENNKLLSYFPHGPKRLYFDVLLSLIADRPVLDYWKFEDFIQEIYGRYEEQRLSLYELLVQEKGETCAEYIKGLI
jgi:hypothetical protein